MGAITCGIESVIAGRSEVPLREFATRVMGVPYSTAWERYRRGSLNVTVTQAVAPTGTTRGSALMVPAGEARRYSAAHGIGTTETASDPGVFTLPPLPKGTQWVVKQEPGRLLVEAQPV